MTRASAKIGKPFSDPPQKCWKFIHTGFPGRDRCGLPSEPESGNQARHTKSGPGVVRIAAPSRCRRAASPCTPMRSRARSMRLCWNRPGEKTNPLPCHLSYTASWRECSKCTG